MNDATPRALTARLRAATRTLHTEAERAGVMRKLLRGTLERRSYIALLRNLHAIYATLESALTRHATLPALAAFPFASLRRAGALAADLAVVGDVEWAGTHPLRPAAVDYVERLTEIDRAAPALLLAHAYTRYLGDLNGGQRLRDIAARAYGLQDGRGTAFYDFGSTAEVDARIEAFRDALDRAPIDAGTSDAIVAEAQRAFALHVRLFEELAGG